MDRRTCFFASRFARVNASKQAHRSSPEALPERDWVVLRSERKSASSERSNASESRDD
ncbi:hypothetical protein NOR53_100 [gamma proteobacterium NOR5-3]|nr:hypothetical protein NOR53_100 [gamma proteobacterium NOR5-3]